MIRQRKRVINQEEWVSHQQDLRAFKHHELVERATHTTLHCKICNAPITWGKTSFSNLTCGPKCRAVYAKRQTMSLVL